MGHPKQVTMLTVALPTMLIVLQSRFFLKGVGAEEDGGDEDDDVEVSPEDVSPKDVSPEDVS